MDFYAQYLKVSFRKEHNGNDEFIALRAASGEQKRKSPALCQALPAVQPPVSALRSLSSGALSSGPAEETLTPGPLPVNSLERIAP
jgi:hypothetical protein